MNIEELTLYCQSLKQVTTEILWENVLVFKVGGKMFCFVPMDEADLKMNLKCEPVEAIFIQTTILGPSCLIPSISAHLSWELASYSRYTLMARTQLPDRQGQSLKGSKSGEVKLYFKKNVFLDITKI